MAMRLAIGSLFIIGSIYAQGQERVIDLREVNKVVDTWTEALNNKDLTALEGLYADEVIFYAKKLPRVSCLGIKSKRLQSSKFFYQEIINQPVIRVYDTDVIRASFVKQITSGDVVTDYDAYLLIKRIEGKLRIIGESDLIVDGKEKFVLDIGNELETSLLSNSRLGVGSEITEGEKSGQLMLLASAGGVLLIGLSFVLYRVIRRNRGRDNNARVLVAARQTDNKKKQKAVDDGLAFEKFIVSRFNPKYFKLLEWTSDKISEGIYARSAMNPDLHYEFKYMTCSKEFAMECKYRRALFNGKLELEPRQIENYRRYSREKSIPVYVAVGLGGEPSAPEELYVIPLDLFLRTTAISYSSIGNYYTNPEKGFFLDPGTEEFRRFRRPGTRHLP